MSGVKPDRPQTLEGASALLASAEAERRKTLTPRERRARTVARLAAVQALYQLEFGGEGVDTVVQEFSDHRFESDLEGQPLGEADEAYFGEIVRGVVAQQAEIDRRIAARLSDGWKLERIDSTARAILRAGAWELAFSRNTPVEVVIDEYVELAKSFFATADIKFVNAALDGVARDVRA